MLNFAIEPQIWPIAGKFTISRGAKTQAQVISVRVRAEGHTGRGECVPYPRYGESVDGVMETIKKALLEVHDRGSLQSALPAGAARNALDCALIDLEAKASGLPAWQLLGLPAPEPVITCYTISLGTPDEMASAAEKASTYALLKVKLGGDGDGARIAAVRAAAPESRLVVDANEAWTEATFAPNIMACAAAGVELIEQPLPAHGDGALANLPRPVPVCADESLHTLADLPSIAGLYNAINIKLDKTGGLTGAITLAEAARKLDLKIMVGCMVGTSLAMAPALLLTPYAQWVDLDGPLLLAKDVEPSLQYEGSIVHPPLSPLWG